MNEDAGPPVKELAFRLPDLPEVRHFAAIHARDAGLTEESVGDLLIAVNEVATNAVTHGTSGKARLRVWNEQSDLVVEIHDEGRWNVVGRPGSAAPTPYATHGMGLWVARKLTNGITFRTGHEGSTVTMRFARRRPR
ncbi:ATP-binding protein [Nonomuraea dietziae]|uniref:ATP-binding protein n=1 Tax=Nonomuraea dietziae TaxID=65515 RepID=UPI0033E65FC7